MGRNRRMGEAGMIARLLVGVARSLFAIATLLALAAVLCLYGSYRALRAATVGVPPPPIRTAGFELMAAIVTLARAVASSSPDKAPATADRVAGGIVEIFDREEEATT